MKHLKWLSLVLLIVMLVSACGGATPTAETPDEGGEPDTGGEEAPPPEQEGPFRAAVVMPSATNAMQSAGEPDTARAGVPSLNSVSATGIS